MGSDQAKEAEQAGTQASGSTRDRRGIAGGEAMECQRRQATKSTDKSLHFYLREVMRKQGQLEVSSQPAVFQGSKATVGHMTFICPHCEVCRSNLELQLMLLCQKDSPIVESGPCGRCFGVRWRM